MYCTFWSGADEKEAAPRGEGFGDGSTRDSWKTWERSTTSTGGYIPTSVVPWSSAIA